MKVKKVKEIPYSSVEMEDVEGVKKKILISEADGAPNFRMRLFSVEPGGHTPFHTHDYEHEIIVLSGKGKVISHDEERDLQQGKVCLVPPGEKHQFVNDSQEEFQFICLIPENTN